MRFWNSEKEVRFERVASEDSEGLLSDAEQETGSLSSPRPPPRGPSWSAAAASVILTALLSAAAGAWAAHNGGLNPDAYTIRHISQYSPIVDEVGVHYSLIRFNGSLLKNNVFRQDAGPEVDAAWKTLGVDYHAARIPAEKAVRSGLAPDQVKIKEKYGGGYPAHVEGMHHLHCLNLLRKSLKWNFDYYQKQGLGPFSNPPDIVKYHVTHCLDTLRQQLMCTVDVGVLGQVWYQPEGKPVQAFVDFNTVHKCRNFDEVRAWAEEHQLPAVEDAPVDLLEPPMEGDRIWHEVP